MTEIDAFLQGREGDLAGLVREVTAWTAALGGALDELARERMEGADAREVVRARVSGTGGLLGLSIDARRLRDLDHVELAEAVKQAIGAAKGAMGERLTELTEGLSGRDPSLPGGDPLAPHIERVLREG
ncbi:YbaB/EbfC family nucleoid-associated protein [Nonomuraea fuscirosea]|uniref:YbaB/EbfC family nucleoid-associated protein n=1 Tax=Nonomuraea fuscirosea TaxID=1291556 RepID=UPI002DD9D69E|nr:YbaB/EbfC family nucleoid-associated protein [Nonomuraea fuscirosea]WSA50375.1 YbaB/EbfC family nucleoid-associated protein [Nonomuraea fuscirosea]